MESIEIGNWLITQQGIQWNGKDGREYSIDNGTLRENGVGIRAKCYNILLHMAEKNWLTPADIYTLNTAFIYAMEANGKSLSERSFVETLKQQQTLIRFMNNPVK